MTKKPPSVDELLMVFVMLYQDKGADEAIKSLNDTLFRYCGDVAFDTLSDLFKEVLVRATVLLTNGYLTMSAYYLRIQRTTLYYMIKRINKTCEEKDKIISLPRSWDGRHDVRQCCTCKELFIGTAANSCPFCRERERIKLYGGKYRESYGTPKTHSAPWRKAARTRKAPGRRKYKSKQTGV